MNRGHFARASRSLLDQQQELLETVQGISRGLDQAKRGEGRPMREFLQSLAKEHRITLNLSQLKKYTVTVTPEAESNIREAFPYIYARNPLLVDKPKLIVYVPYVRHGRRKTWRTAIEGR